MSSKINIIWGLRLPCRVINFCFVSADNKSKYMYSNQTIHGSVFQLHFSVHTVGQFS